MQPRRRRWGQALGSVTKRLFCPLIFGKLRVLPFFVGWILKKTEKKKEGLWPHANMPRGGMVSSPPCGDDVFGQSSLAAKAGEIRSSSDKTTSGLFFLFRLKLNSRRHIFSY
jgi:hypothetical protein